MPQEEGENKVKQENVGKKIIADFTPMNYHLLLLKR
jgi:hypothetical protein